MHCFMNVTNEPQSRWIAAKNCNLLQKGCTDYLWTKDSFVDTWKLTFSAFPCLKTYWSMARDQYGKQIYKIPAGLRYHVYRIPCLIPLPKKHGKGEMGFFPHIMLAQHSWKALSMQCKNKKFKIVCLPTLTIFLL